MNFWEKGLRKGVTGNKIQFNSDQSLSCVQLFVTPWTAAYQASLVITNFWSLVKPMSIESEMLSNCLMLCYPLLLLPSLFPSIRVFSNESALHIRWPNYWSFSLSISPSNEYPQLISFKSDWFNLFAVQGTLKSLLRHHSSKSSILPPKSILCHSAFLCCPALIAVHDCWKDHSLALTIGTFVS